MDKKLQKYVKIASDKKFGNEMSEERTQWELIYSEGFKDALPFAVEKAIQVLDNFGCSTRTTRRIMNKNITEMVVDETVL